MDLSQENRPATIPGPLLVALHLVPGLAFGGVFFLLSRMFIGFGLTGYLALLVSIPLCLAPIEIGVMLFWSARETGRISLPAAILYGQRGTAVDYLLWPPLLFLCWGLLSVVTAPVSQFFGAHFSAWLPAWATQESLLQDLVRSPAAQRPATLALAVLLSGVVAPVIEEAYFRGFLLPRMAHWGYAAPVVNALLFAVYHFYFPENVPGIFVAFAPAAWLVMVRKNWRIALVFHMMINLGGVYTVAMVMG